MTLRVRSDKSTTTDCSGRVVAVAPHGASSDQVERRWAPSGLWVFQVATGCHVRQSDVFTLALDASERLSGSGTLQSMAFIVRAANPDFHPLVRAYKRYFAGHEMTT